MKNRTTFFLSGSFFVIFTVVSCKTAELGFKVFDISGMVYDFSNRPVANCEVSLGWRYKSNTDINGRFTFNKVAVGNYTITGHKKNFESYSEKIAIKDRGQIIYIRIPSQYQLLNLAEEALSANNYTLADEISERALQIDNKNIETLFYCAAIKFRQGENEKALVYLENAKNLGTKDPYVEKFLILLKEKQSANIAN
jgi:tetratricopeptide (TPR) repeat protein